MTVQNITINFKNNTEPMNLAIPSRVNLKKLHWLKNLGKMNLSFSYNMRKDLAVKNIESAKELGIYIDESIEMVNNRLWSENAWKQRMILEALILALCDRLNLDTKDLNEESGFRLAAFIRGLYEGAQQSWDNVKIKK